MFVLLSRNTCYFIPSQMILTNYFTQKKIINLVGIMHILNYSVCTHVFTHCVNMWLHVLASTARQRQVSFTGKACVNRQFRPVAHTFNKFFWRQLLGEVIPRFYRTRSSLLIWLTISRSQESKQAR